MQATLTQSHCSKTPVTPRFWPFLVHPDSGSLFCKRFCISLAVHSGVKGCDTHNERHCQHRVSIDPACRGNGPSTCKQEGPFHYTGFPHPPIVRSTLQAPGQVWDQHPWQKCITKFTGSEPRDTMIPRWLCDAVLLNRIPSVKESKAGFSLMPAQVLFFHFWVPDICMCPPCSQASQVKFSCMHSNLQWVVCCCSLYTGPSTLFPCMHAQNKECLMPTLSPWLDASLQACCSLSQVLCSACFGEHGNMANMAHAHLHDMSRHPTDTLCHKPVRSLLCF